MSTVTDDLVSGFVNGYLACARDAAVHPLINEARLLEALRVMWPREDVNILQVKLEHTLEVLIRGGHLKKFG